MQLTLILATLATTLFSGVSAGPIPQPIPIADPDTVVRPRPHRNHNSLADYFLGPL